ncbi:SnodProt1 [Exidia glandulosa HHB12029]|uniref:SnodProt1 n=1 Tax=Exidia glandulosa HHB12029 TaxID=1314781 RepID=A0A165FGH2_EXIGL|nr:SnodProt1 [Exidia glandulosa HHB12029]
MRVIALLTAVLPLSFAASTTSKGTVSYDTTYDNSKLSTLNTACSDGSHGLYTKGFKTIGQLKTFPFVGGAPEITDWNSSQCGGCYKITYGNKTVTFTAIDKANTLNMGLNAMNTLTGGKAKKLGNAKVTYQKVSEKECGL